MYTEVLKMLPEDILAMKTLPGNAEAAEMLLNFAVVVGTLPGGTEEDSVVMETLPGDAVAAETGATTNSGKSNRRIHISRNKSSECKTSTI